MVGNNYFSEKNSPNEKNQPVIKAYGKRWIILIIYILYATLSTFQWVEYSIITNIVEKYYNVSASAVNWTSMVFMLMWPILVFPSSFIINKMGLRTAGLLGAVATLLGAAVKLLSVRQDLFYVVLIGQTIAAISQTFILSLPPKIAVTWFRPEEVSTVCSLGIFGMTFGSAMGFLVPPMIVKDSDNINDLGDDFKLLCWGISLAALPAALMVVFYFPDEPVHAPSLAMYEERENRTVVTLSVFGGSIKKLMQNKSFLLHAVAYGCNVAIFSAIGTLLNPFVLHYFEGAQEDAGRMGLVMIITGMVGSILTGVVLDKTHKYKETAIVIFTLSAVAMGGFLFALEMKSKWMVYLAISIFGFFLNSYLPAGVEFATEITFPSPESMVAGLLMTVSQILAVIFTVALGEIDTRYGTFWAILAQAVILAIGTILTVLTPNKLKRQAAFKKGTLTPDVHFEKVPLNEPS